MRWTCWARHHETQTSAREFLHQLQGPDFDSWLRGYNKEKKSFLVHRLPNSLSACWGGDFASCHSGFFPIKESAAGWRFPLGVERFSLLPGFADSLKNTFIIPTRLPQGCSLIRGSKIFIKALGGRKNLLFLMAPFQKGCCNERRITRNLIFPACAPTFGNQSEQVLQNSPAGFPTGALSKGLLGIIPPLWRFLLIKKQKQEERRIKSHLSQTILFHGFN